VAAAPGVAAGVGSAAGVAAGFGGAGLASAAAGAPATGVAAGAVGFAGAGLAAAVAFPSAAASAAFAPGACACVVQKWRLHAGQTQNCCGAHAAPGAGSRISIWVPQRWQRSSSWSSGTARL